MKKIILLAFVALMFAGCLEKTFCQEIQPDVANYFGADVAARMGSVDENSPQMQLMRSLSSGRNGSEIHMGMCMYNSGKNTVSIIYQNSSIYGGKSVEEMAPEVSLNAYNTSRIVKGGDYAYSYYEGTRRISGTNYTTIMLHMRRGSTDIQVVTSSIEGGRNYTEGTMRDFALEVSRKLDRQQ